MKRGKKTDFGLLWQSLLNLFFKILYFVINFFIFVGEYTRKVAHFVFFCVTFLLSIIPTVARFLVNLISKRINRIVIAIKNKIPAVFSSTKQTAKHRAESIIAFKKRITTTIKPSYYIRLFLKKSREVQAPKIQLPKITIPIVPEKKSYTKLSERSKENSLRLTLFSAHNITLKLRYLLFGCALTLIGVFAVQSYAFVKDLPSPSNIGKVNYPLSTHIYDRNGKLLYEFYRNENRTPVRLEELPRFIPQAAVAIEDKDFYKHKGVSLISGVLRAARENLLNHDTFQGGSTITQQLVKSALLTPERTVTRKVKEIILALWTERIFSKDQIIEMYLNQVPYGGSSYGVEEASRVYFGKHAKDVTLAEAAMLAGLPQAPSLYSPYVNPDLAKARRNEVLEKMYEQNYIDKAQKDKAQNEPVIVIPPKTNINAPHFVFYVKSLLEEMYGIQAVEEGGLHVVTTLDLDLQKQVESILRDEIEKVKNLNVGNGAVLVTRPSTGEILAMVGSADYFASPSGAFNVTTALRQPGSSIKPIMYSLALQKGFTAATIIEDTPTIFTIPGSESYKPVNYDGRFHGSIPLRYALANSYNIPAVKALNAIGVNNLVEYGRKLGISTWTDPSRFGLSLTLGGGEVTMVDMAEAFGVLADEGYKTDSISIMSIKDSAGNQVYEASPLKTRVINQGVAYIISDILADNLARQFAFGLGSALEIPGYKVAVKTGTTDEKKDNWTIGYTPEFLTAVWVGNNDNTPMNPYLTSGVTGAAPIWNKVMTYILKTYQKGNGWYEQPENIVARNCYFGRPEYFLIGTENTASCRTSIFTPKPSDKKDKDGD